MEVFPTASLIPQDKHDVASVRRASQAGFPAVEPILDELLEWVQDANWPVAQELLPFLATIGSPLAPHIQRIFASTNYLWQYWLCGIIQASPELYSIHRETLRRIAWFPTPEEHHEELDERCLEVVAHYNAITAKELGQRIRVAFAGIKLGNGIGLRQAWAIDDYEDARTCSECRASDEKSRWDRLSSKELKRGDDCLFHFDAEGMRFHLPAVLLTDLAGNLQCELALTLATMHEADNHSFSLLNKAQRKVLVDYFLHAADTQEYRNRRDELLEIVRSHWNPSFL